MDSMFFFLLMLGAVVAALGFAGWKLHQFSLSKYSYTPFNVLHVVFTLGSAVAVVSVLFTLAQTDSSIIEWIGRITSLSTIEGDWTAFILFLIAIVLLVVVYFRSYQNTDHWIAVASTTIMWVLSVIVVLVALLIYVMRESKKSKQQG